MKTKTVFPYLHSFMFRDYLKRWLDCHPRTRWWRSGKDTEQEALTMSVSAWRKFCKDYNQDFKKL